MHHHLGVRDGDQLLDLACGSGLALELALARGATVSGIDASARLVAIAGDRLPDADVRVGDMAALPWTDGSFDVVTSFRGLWATTRQALVRRAGHYDPAAGSRLAPGVTSRRRRDSGRWRRSRSRPMKR